MALERPFTKTNRMLNIEKWILNTDKSEKEVVTDHQILIINVFPIAVRKNKAYQIIWTRVSRVGVDRWNLWIYECNRSTIALEVGIFMTFKRNVSRFKTIQR